MPEGTTQTSAGWGQDKAGYEKLLFFIIRLVALLDFLKYICMCNIFIKVIFHFFEK